MMQGNQAGLHINTGAHVHSTADKYSHLTIPHFLEQCFTFVVRIGRVDIYNLFARNAVIVDKSVNNVCIGIIFLALARYACITEDKLRAFLGVKLLVYLSYILTGRR